ncbi:hypothetical protein STEG23_001753 [Scotinomys teguina]
MGGRGSDESKAVWGREEACPPRREDVELLLALFSCYGFPTMKDYDLNLHFSPKAVLVLEEAPFSVLLREASSAIDVNQYKDHTQFLFEGTGSADGNDGHEADDAEGGDGANLGTETEESVGRAESNQIAADSQNSGFHIMILMHFLIESLFSLFDWTPGALCLVLDCGSLHLPPSVIGEKFCDDS